MTNNSVAVAPTREEVSEEQKIQQMLNARRNIAVLTGIPYIFALEGVILLSLAASNTNVFPARAVNATTNTTSLTTGHEQSYQIKFSSIFTAASLLVLAAVNAVAWQRNHSHQEIKLANLAGITGAAAVDLFLVTLFASTALYRQHDGAAASVGVSVAGAFTSVILGMAAVALCQSARPIVADAVEDQAQRTDGADEMCDPLLEEGDVTNGYGATDGSRMFSRRSSSNNSQQQEGSLNRSTSAMQINGVVQS